MNNNQFHQTDKYRNLNPIIGIYTQGHLRKKKDHTGGQCYSNRGSQSRLIHKCL